MERVVISLFACSNTHPDTKPVATSFSPIPQSQPWISVPRSLSSTQNTVFVFQLVSSLLFFISCPPTATILHTHPFSYSKQNTTITRAHKWSQWTLGVPCSLDASPMFNTQDCLIIQLYLSSPSLSHCSATTLIVPLAWECMCLFYSYICALITAEGATPHP